MNGIVRRTWAASVLAVGVFAGSALAQPDKGPPEIVRHGTNPHNMGEAVTIGSTGVIKPSISFHGGPIMGAVTPHLIWYGNWNQSNGTDTAAGQQLVVDFLSNLSGSDYYKINTTYGVSATVNPPAQTTVGYSRKTSSLTDADIQAIVWAAIGTGMPDYSGVYFVLTSSDVNESSGFCTNYCGWHTSATLNNTPVKYAFVGNAARCLNACAMQSTSPNNNAGVDGMLSVIAHELEEAATDPQLNAWYNSRGSESSDMCAWTFGSTQFQTANGAWANLKLGTRSYLIQRQLAKDSKCYMSYPTQQ